MIVRSGGKWYVGVYLSNECSQDAVLDDVDALVKKSEKGVNEFTMIGIDDLFDGVSFERAEKNAVTALKRAHGIDFGVDVKRARIMHIFPLPERVELKDTTWFRARIIRRVPLPDSSRNTRER